ncbi:MAG: hypothetical protein OXG87_10140 [Gemmatimonadetes bacterium]|nr:hypothetical protein [Gemmatimonadota bacterium]
MVSINFSDFRRFAKFFEKHDLQSSVTQLAGLLTVPSLHANTLRIETAIHLTVANCEGSRNLKLAEIDHWLNQYLGNRIAIYEDPVEDVFITNVETHEGNRRIFQGIWESSDYFVQAAINILSIHLALQECRNLLSPAFALLKLSDSVAERVGLRRWHNAPSTAKDKIGVACVSDRAERAQAVIFSDSELNAMGIKRHLLAPFILRYEDRQALKTETIGKSSLEKRPLIDFGDKVVLALPNAVSPAIRTFILSELRRRGYLSAFSRALATYQAKQVEGEVFKQLEQDVFSLKLPEFDRKTPPLHAWLLKYDVNKYLHVVLVHDRLDSLKPYDLSGFMTYPQELMTGLNDYISKTASYCMSLPDFNEGMTLLIMGGLGRGFALGFDECPDQWHLSAISISNLLMLGHLPDQPITRYLKYIKQRTWVDKEGVTIQDMSGDLNSFSYWRQSNYQIVPHDLAIDSPSMLIIENDWILVARQEVRNLVDRHVLKTTDGIYVPVVRFFSNSYFKSVCDRPIYASLIHLSSGIFAGTVETARGPSWLVMIRESDEKFPRFLYDIWEGFIGLYDRLVSEIESLYPDAPFGPVEIKLNADDVIDVDGILIVEKNMKPQIDTKVNEFEVTIQNKQRTAVVKLPPDFLQYFQQPENTGERIVLRSIAKGLISLHQDTNKNVDKDILEALLNKVISDPGMRILHAFPIDPIEQLKAKQNQAPIFIAQEDFAFSKLKLSEGCTSATTIGEINSKVECNEFLHKVVDKIWSQIRSQLKQLDRASVIREALRVHEAIIYDREHWRRTAQAVQALHASEEDVIAISRGREADRVNTAISARTIIEMAICECPKTGGRQLSRWKLDELLAKVTLLLEVARVSDAVKNDLVTPRIELHPNGEYTIDHEFQSTVIKPFLESHFSKGFKTAVQEYRELYENESYDERKRPDEIFSSELIHASRVEFGLSLDEAVEGISKLMDLAVEYDSVIVETTLGDIKARLTSNRGLSVDASEAFVRSFGIFHRPQWDKPPSGFTGKDIYPWRFKRRLSVTAKPLFVFGKQNNDKVLFGIGTLKQSILNLLGRIDEGHLPQEFFTSTEMKQYVGMVNDEKGHAFAQSVANKLCEKGWHTRNEVQMTELGASDKLGDVDVLAWKPSGEIQIVECKRLQLARTVAEFAEICRRFRGEAKDELGKHVKRVEWIRANAACLQHIVGFLPDPSNIDDRLVTNVDVPMTYLTSLPIEADKIGPLKLLNSTAKGKVLK